MARTKKLRKRKRIWVLIVLLVALFVFAYMILYNGGVVVKKTDSTGVISKLKVIQLKGGQFELTQKDIDEISNLYFSSAKNKGDIMVQGVNFKMLDDEILIEAPVSYKNLNLLLSSRGKLNLSNGKIAYVADNFKIGKLKLPKGLVISQISKFNNENFYAEDNSIKINPNVFPFKINSLSIIDSKIIGIAEKLDMKMLFKNLYNSSVEEIDEQLVILNQKLKSASVFMNSEQKEKIKEMQNIIEDARGKSTEEKKQVISDTLNQIENAIN